MQTTFQVSEGWLDRQPILRAHVQRRAHDPAGSVIIKSPYDLNFFFVPGPFATSKPVPGRRSGWPLMVLLNVLATSLATSFRPSAFRPRSSASLFSFWPTFTVACFNCPPTRSAASDARSPIGPSACLSRSVAGNAAATAAPAASPANATARGWSCTTRLMAPWKADRVCWTARSVPSPTARRACPAYSDADEAYEVTVSLVCAAISEAASLTVVAALEMGPLLVFPVCNAPADATEPTLEPRMLKCCSASSARRPLLAAKYLLDLLYGI